MCELSREFCLPVNGEGASCELGAAPDSATGCAQGLGCAPGQAPICVPSGADATECAVGDDEACAPGEVCHRLYSMLPGSSGMGRCLPPRPPGGWCFRDTECMARAHCENTEQGFAICQRDQD